MSSGNRCPYRSKVTSITRGTPSDVPEAALANLPR
jgi:hypothetical protein